MIVNAEDGEHVRVFSRWADCADAMLMEDFTAGQMRAARDMPEDAKAIRRTDDWGRRLRVERVQPGMRAAVYKALVAAYGARECGTLTERQRLLLAVWRW